MLRAMFISIGVLGLTAGPGHPDSPTLNIEKVGDEYRFKVGSEIVTKLLARPSLSKPILHPLRLPGGPNLSRDWPIVDSTPGESRDHVHQKSAWLAHGDVVPEGVELTTRIKGVRGIDFWSEVAGRGQIEVKSAEDPKIAPGQATLRLRAAWKSAEGRVVLDEVRTLTMVPVEAGLLIVVRTQLKASAVPVTFADTKEGFFAVRVSDKLCVSKNPESVISLSTGVRGAAACWGIKADWCDYSGSIDGKPVGLAIFDDPKNRSRACWHVRETGLMAANPFGRAASGFPAQKQSPEPLVRLAAGEELSLRYACYLHNGDAAVGRVSEVFRQFRGMKD
ncbi:MAG: PmoA family protein [Gemmataceae bacterium]|nr:PmoA family protein [Gemmataceae bacterium]